MRTMIRTLVFLAPLAVVACKKSAPPEPAPVAAEEPAPAPAPDLEWSWGPATFAGPQSGDEPGKLTVPVTIKNNTSKGLIVSSYDVGVKGEDGRVCVGRGDEMMKSSDGALEFSVKADCMFSKIPAGDEIKLLGTVVYQLGGEEMTADVKAKVAFKP